jgi:hypothetical protein
MSDELQSISAGIAQILTSNRSLENVIQKRLDNIDKDISILFEANDAQDKLIAKLEISIELLKELRLESREDLLKLSDRVESFNREVYDAIDVAMSQKNAICEKVHEKYNNDLSYAVAETEVKFAGKLTEHKKLNEESIKNSGLTTTNKILSFRLWFALGGWTIATAVITFILSKVFGE